MISFTNEHEPSIAGALRDLGWTIEPPREITPESLAELGVPTVFSPAHRIISISRGDGDATLDLTVEQAQIVVYRLVDWVRYHEEYFS